MCTIIAEFDKDGRPYQRINEEELKESLRCEIMENCTPQFCCTCQEKFLTEVDSKAHYVGKPHQRLLQIKLKVMLRKKINEENSRKKIVNSEVLNSGTIATEIKQIVTAEMLGVKNGIKEETIKRKADHLDEKCDLPSDVLEKCQPTYCGVCFITLTSEIVSSDHYAGKPHKKKLKLLEMGPNLKKADFEINRQGSKHKSKEVQLEALGTRSVKQEVKTEQAISIQSMKSGTAPQKENINGHKKKPYLIFTCDLCQASCNTQRELERHFNGKAHKKKLNLKFKCDLCQFSCISQEMLNGHLNGKAHKDKLDLKFKCDLCQFSCISQEMLDAHLNGKAHKKMNGTAQKKPDLKFECDLCQVLCNAQESLEAHLIGKAHQKKLNLIEKGQNPVSCNAQEMLAAHLQVVSHVSSEDKDEEIDDGEDKDVPDLCDSMSNLAGYSDIIKNNELKIKLNIKEEELLHPAEIEKSSTRKSSEEEDIVLVTENIEVKKSSKGDDECEEADWSDDDLIILENPDCSSPQKSIKKTPTLNNAPLVESVKLCVYPVGQSDSVTLSTQDYATLAYDTFLNDIIIDFYLLYLANNVLSSNNREKVHIFSTMFYKRLLQSPRADAKKVPEYENDATLTPSEIRHFRVASWTKSVDLFEKDMLIIPICEEFHWYLLLVVKPGVIFLPFEAKERKERGEPFMIVLDSVGGRNNSSAKNIRRYLACEWNKRKCGGAELLSNLEQMGKKMSKLRPKKPEQENNSDCGIFLLQYVETVFKNVSAFMWPFLVNMRTKEWFTSQEVAGKRGEIAELIKRLTEEQKPGEVIEYPNIKFTAKGVEEV